MASIVNYSDGLKRIEFSPAPNATHQVIRLGRVNVNVARLWLDKVNAIIADKLAGRPHDQEASRWLASLDEKMLGRLRAVGLAEGVGLVDVSLKVCLERFMEALVGKQSTRTSYGNVVRNLGEFFGGERAIRSITTSDADRWRAWMVENQKLATPTISRRVIAARTIWNMAIRWKLAGENVFAGVKTGLQENEGRKRFIKHDLINKVMDQCPDNEWKLILALARYAGMRVPSEIFALRWRDIDWEHGRFIVHSAKTEHHVGKGTRVVPLFAELHPYLLAAFEEAEPGAEFCISKHRLGGLNLRQQLERFIERAGETPWPRLFQNLRASRESELMREYDLATTCKWIGNSPGVAARHYAMCVDLDADFSRAAVKGQAPEQETQRKTQRKAQMQAVNSKCTQLTEEGPDNEKTPENQGFVASDQLHAHGSKKAEWALQGSNL